MGLFTKCTTALTWLIVFTALVFVNGQSTSKGRQDAAHMLMANMDPNGNACNNFYEYACGNISNTMPSGSMHVKGNYWDQMLNVLKELGSMLSSVKVPSKGLPKSVQAASKLYQTCVSANYSESNPIILNTISSWNIGGWPMVTQNWALPSFSATTTTTTTSTPTTSTTTTTTPSTTSTTTRTTPTATTTSTTTSTTTTKATPTPTSTTTTNTIPTTTSTTTTKATPATTSTTTPRATTTTTSTTTTKATPSATSTTTPRATTTTTSTTTTKATPATTSTTTPRATTTTTSTTTTKATPATTSTTTPRATTTTTSTTTTKATPATISTTTPRATTTTTSTTTANAIPILLERMLSQPEFRMENLAGHLLGHYQVPTFFNSVVMADLVNPQNFSLITTQATLPLGSRQYYIHPKFANFRKLYLNMIISVSKQIRSLINSKVTDKQIMLDAQAILQLEIDLARKMRPPSELRNIQANYVTLSYSDIIFRWPKFNWRAYFSGLLEYNNNNYIVNTLSGLGKVFTFGTPGYIDELHHYVGNPSNQRTVFNYMVWRFVYKNVVYLPESPMHKEYEEFYKVYRKSIIFTGLRGYVLQALNEVKALPPPPQMCALLVLRSMPYVAGYIYANHYFQGQSVINEINSMISDVKSSVRNSFTQTPWFDTTSRVNIQSKLANMYPNVGYPRWMIDPVQLDAYYNDPKVTALVTNATVDFYQSVLSVNLAFLGKYYGQLGTKPSKTNFIRSPATVNAWNDLSQNSINIPMGILAPPFYRSDFPRVINYAGIGIVIGHEITHNFDDQGIQIDANGYLNPLLTSQSAQSFARNAQCLISQYNSYCYPNIQYQCVNGRNSQGENIADLNGVLTAYNAYKAWVKVHGSETPLPGFENYSWDKIFFLQYANMWCSSSTNNALLDQVLQDPHSPDMRRVNGVLRNLPQFQTAFRCSVRSPMTPSADQQCQMFGPVPVPSTAPTAPPTVPPPSSNQSAWSAAGKVIKSNLNTTVNPCNDFYQFACGGWQTRNPLGRRRGIDIMQQMRQNTDNAIARAMNNIHSNNHAISKTLGTAKTYYSACVQWTNTKPKHEFENIKLSLDQFNFGGWPAITPNWSLPSHPDFNGGWNVVGNLEFEWLVPSFLTTFVGVDWKNVSRNAIIIDQGTLGMLRQQFYIGGQYAHQRNFYVLLIKQTIQKLATFTGANVSDAVASADAMAILNFEKNIAGFIQTPANREQNIATLYNSYNVNQIQTRWPYIDWETYMSKLGIHIDLASLGKKFIFYNPNYIDFLHGLLKATPNRLIANYLGWRFLQSNLEFLEDFRVLRGNNIPISNNTFYNQRCVDHINRYMPMAAGRIYAGTLNNNAQARSDVSFLAQRVVAGFSQMIQDLPWMDPATKNIALAKASGTIQNIAYPDWLMNDQVLDQYHKGYWSNNSGFNPFAISQGDSYYNMYKKLKINYLRTILRRISIPGDRTYFPVSPSETRAVNEWALNSITVPLALMQSPLYAINNPQSINFGGLGSVIARELSHGFDSIGVHFSSNGTLSTWLSPFALSAFAREKQCVITQYSNICFGPAVRNQCVNGQQTLFENIAEIAGVRAAYYAYEKYQSFFGVEPSVPGLEELTNEQLFFTNFAQQFCENQSNEALMDKLVLSSDAPNKYRVNAVLKDFPLFAKAFKCQAHSPMAQQSCKVWD